MSQSQLTQVQRAELEAIARAAVDDEAKDTTPPAPAAPAPAPQAPPAPQPPARPEPGRGAPPAPQPPARPEPGRGAPSQDEEFEDEELPLQPPPKIRPWPFVVAMLGLVVLLGLLAWFIWPWAFSKKESSKPSQLPKPTATAPGLQAGGLPLPAPATQAGEPEPSQPSAPSQHSFYACQLFGPQALARWEGHLRDRGFNEAAVQAAVSDPWVAEPLDQPCPPQD